MVGVAHPAEIRLVAPETWPRGLIMTNALIMIVDLATIAAVIMVLRRGGLGLRALLGRFRPKEIWWSLLVLAIALVGFLAASLIAYGGARRCPVSRLRWRSGSVSARCRRR